MRKHIVGAFLLAGMLIPVGGCTGVVETAVDATADRAAERTGEIVGERIGEAAGAMIVAQFPDTWTNRWRRVYAGYLFNVAFYANGYAVTDQAYAPGEWTRWQMVEEGEQTNAVLKRAFLERTEDGNEWWHVTYENTETDEAIVLEALFSPEREEMLRLRGKFPGEEPEEMPVEENTYGYSEPTQLTEESVEGATVGTESITVPAGTFEARHVRYGAAGGTFEWWINDSVPGDLVKYLRQVDDDTETGSEELGYWVVELEDYGDGAESELGVLDE